MDTTTFVKLEKRFFFGLKENNGLDKFYHLWLHVFLKKDSFLKFNTKWLCAKSGIKYYQLIWVTRMVLIFSKLSQLWDYSDSCPIWNYRMYNQSAVQSW